jgi:hypothetical protein
MSVGKIKSATLGAHLLLVVREDACYSTFDGRLLGISQFSHQLQVLPVSFRPLLHRDSHQSIIHSNNVLQPCTRFHLFHPSQSC